MLTRLIECPLLRGIQSTGDSCFTPVNQRLGEDVPPEGEESFSRLYPSLLCLSTLFILASFAFSSWPPHTFTSPVVSCFLWGSYLLLPTTYTTWYSNSCNRSVIILQMFTVLSIFFTQNECRMKESLNATRWCEHSAPDRCAHRLRVNCTYPQLCALLSTHLLISPLGQKNPCCLWRDKHVSLMQSHTSITQTWWKKLNT